MSLATGNSSPTAHSQQLADGRELTADSYSLATANFELWTFRDAQRRGDSLRIPLGKLSSLFGDVHADFLAPGR